MDKTRVQLIPVGILLSALLCTLALPVSVFAQASDPESVAATSLETVSAPDQQITTDPTALGYTIESFPGSSDVIGDFVVGPGKIELSLKPGETKKVELTATNRTGVDRIFKFSTEDTTGSADGSEAIILLGNDTGPYSLKDYLKIPKTGLLIKHGQRLRIPVEVSIPPNAEAGGLYGSVLVETVTLPVEPDANSAAVARSPLITRIGTLFFVTVEGDIERSSELKDFTTNLNKKFFTSGPIAMNVVYENSGSIHVVPYGELEIFNYSGDSVGFVELDPWFVMPKSLRNREVTWDREFLIGKYTAVLRINRGYDNIVDEMSISFWVLPWKVGAAVFLGLFLLFFLTRFFATRFEFKRKE